jgi:hypothetical protein
VASYKSYGLEDLLTICSEEVTFAFKGEGLAVLLAMLKACVSDDERDLNCVIEREGSQQRVRRTLDAR